MNSKQPLTFKALLQHQSDCCKHEGPCFISFLKTIKRSFLTGYSIRASFNALFALLKLRQSLKNPGSTFYKIFLCDGDFRLPAFITVMNSLMRLSQCILRYFRGKDDGFIAFFCGFLGAFVGMMFENPKNYYTWRMYIGSRAIEMIYGSLINRGIIKKNAMHYTYAFALCSTLVAKGYTHDPMIVDKEIFKLYHSFSHLSKEEDILHICQVLSHERVLMKKLGRPFDGLSISEN